MSYTPTVVTAAPTQASHLTKLDYALAWADRGFPVFPLQENGKEPLGGSSGHLRATVDAAEIRTLWTDPLSGMSLEYNIGCGAPPGYLFLDLDEKDGRNGKAKYEALGGTVDGLVVRTPSGGFHVYLKTERDTANTAGKVAPGIDTRGQDGYLVAPGSTIDGVRYEVVQDDSPLAAPQFLMDRLPDPTERIQTVTTYAVEPDQPGNIERAVYWAKVAPSAVSGTWHTEGFKRGCEMARIGLSAEKAVEVLREHWIPRGSGFKSDDQFVRDVLGGYHAAVHDGEHGQESVDAAEASFIGIAVEPPPPDTERESALFTPGKLRLLTVADCANSTPRQYVVKGLLSAGDVGIVMGAPGAGKSVFAPHVAYGVARGVNVFGRRTKQGKVFYLPAEDVHGMRSRVTALGMKHGDTAGFFVLDGASDLYGPDGQAAELGRLVRYERPALVVIDTLAAAFPGLEENASESMGVVLRVARDLARGEGGRPGPAVLILHHTPKADGGTPRGHGSLAGDADIIVQLTRDPDADMIVGTLTKNRNGESYGVVLPFTIESCYLGTDEDGDARTAPVAAEVDPKTVIKRTKLAATEAKALGILHDVVAEGGPGVSANGQQWSFMDVQIPDGPTVTVETWKVACSARMLAASDDPQSQARAFRRALAGLQKKRAIGLVGGYVWPLEDAPG